MSFRLREQPAEVPHTALYDEENGDGAMKRFVSTGGFSSDVAGAFIVKVAPAKDIAARIQILEPF